jgi:hypothetical protein
MEGTHTGEACLQQHVQRIHSCATSYSHWLRTDQTVVDVWWKLSQGGGGGMQQQNKK